MRNIRGQDALSSHNSASKQSMWLRVDCDNAASAGHASTKGACCENAAGKIRNDVWPWQVPPQLSGADELLDIPLDEDCFQQLLSGDSPQVDDVKAKVGPPPFN